MRRIAPFITLMTLFAVPAAASAADFTPAPGSGSYTADTSTLKLTGPSTNITGVIEGGTAVFRFDTVNIPQGVNVFARGTRPFKLIASGTFTLAGVITASGTNATNSSAVTIVGGAGAGAGGAGFTHKGVGPGGGGVGPAQFDGGGGGGFGGKGARGGSSAAGNNAAGGSKYGELNGAPLQGGSGGGGSSNVSGGGGGGGVALFGSFVTITPTATPP